MNERQRDNRMVLIFSLSWLILNLAQAFFTEILEDEAYYWLYSQFPAWGYFDHPPMVAILIKLGYSIFPNELGVRLFPSILGAASIYLLWQLIPEASRNARLFILTVFAVTLMHLNVAGFIAIPDVPLVFFTILYFILLKRYLSEDRVVQSLLLGLVVALMIYSKYHALLVLFFTILANFRLLLRRSFWLIVVIATALCLPHILWQFKNDFLSFQYHLVDRNDPFQVRQIFEYLGNQLLVTGPLVGAILLYLAFTKKLSDPFVRVLKFNLVGFFAFFLFSSVRGHVEPHWTAAAFPTLIILALMKLPEHPALKKWLKILGYSSIPLVLAIRLYLVWNYLPLPQNVEQMFHRKDTWAGELSEIAGNRPVVFMNKYQYPSVYWFYTGKMAFTRNNILYRRNQFDVWPFEEQLEGRAVLFTSYWDYTEDSRMIHTVFGETMVHDIDKYCSFNRLRIDILEDDIVCISGEAIKVPIRISNPTEKPVDLNCDCDLPPILESSCFGEKRSREIKDIKQQPELGTLAPGEEINLEVPVIAPRKAGHYSLFVSFGSTILLPGINGPSVSLTVED